MTTWTDIPDEVLEPGKPIRSVDTLALRDNPIAIAGGAAGAPRIVTNAIQDAAVNLNKIKTGTSSVSVTLAGQSNLIVILGRGALFPQITIDDGNLVLRPSIGLGTNPDSGRFTISSRGITTDARPLAIHWRFINV